MTTRFWAPQRPTVAPDQVVLALLQPGGDPAGDLGNTLLAVHRAGAAACEAVAKGAVPTEAGLATALATCREAVAGPAVDVVSKALNPSYAGLLIRDVFDDAENAAVQLFRTCVAKGIAPPLAAQRAGAVFGVPSAELGRYAALATDPKTNPVALTDAADRTLLGYVSKLVAEEAGEAKEDVSKSPTGHARELGDSSEGWEEREHPRDATTGRFVHGAPRGGPPVKESDWSSITLPGIQVPGITDEQLGLREEPGALARLRGRFGYGGTAAPTVGTTARDKRQMRQMRQVRSAPKQQGKLAPTGRVAPQGRVQARVGAKVQASVHERAAAKLQVAVQPSAKVFERANEGARESYQRVPAPARSDASFQGTALERVVDDHHYGTLRTPNGEALTYVMTAQDSMGLRRDMPEVAAQPLPGHEAPRLVRAHALAQMTAQPGPALLDIQDSRLSSGAAVSRQENARHAAEEIDPSGYHQPLDARLGPDDPTPYGEEEALLGMRRRLAESVAVDVNGHYRTDMDEAAFEASKVYRDYHDPDVKWAVVPAADQYGDYEMPTIDEFVVADDVRGYMEGGYRHQTPIVDPNQAFLVHSEPETYYDAANKVVVNRWTMTPLDEDEVELYTNPSTARLFDNGRFGKALEGHDAVRFEQQHPRDEDGRFAPTAERQSGVAPLQIPGIRVTPVHEQFASPAPARPAPARRQMRQVRRARPAPITEQATRASAAPRAKVGAKVGARAQARVQAKPMSRVQAIMTATMPSERAKDLPILDDRKRYQLLSKGEFDEILRRLPGGGGGVYPLTAETQHLLRRAEVMDGSQVIGEMNMNLEAEIINNEGEPTRGYVWQRKPVGQGLLRDENDELGMGHHIRRIFEQNPDIAQIHIDYAAKPGYYQLFANREPVGEQVLLELDDELDMSQPVELVEIGKYRAMEMGHRRADLDGAIVALTGEEANPTNARMHQFRLQNVQLRRYRMQNRG